MKTPKVFPKHYFRAFSQKREHFKAHKRRKEWVTIGLSALILMSGGVATYSVTKAPAGVHVNAESTMSKPKVRKLLAKLSKKFRKVNRSNYHSWDNNTYMRHVISALKDVDSNPRDFQAVKDWNHEKRVSWNRYNRRGRKRESYDLHILREAVDGLQGHYDNMQDLTGLGPEPGIDDGRYSGTDTNLGKRLPLIPSGIDNRLRITTDLSNAHAHQTKVISSPGKVKEHFNPKDNDVRGYYGSYHNEGAPKQKEAFWDATTTGEQIIHHPATRQNENGRYHGKQEHDLQKESDSNGVIRIRLPKYHHPSSGILVKYPKSARIRGVGKVDTYVYISNIHYYRPWHGQHSIVLSRSLRYGLMYNGIKDMNVSYRFANPRTKKVEPLDGSYLEMHEVFGLQKYGKKKHEGNDLAANNQNFVKDINKGLESRDSKTTSDHTGESIQGRTGSTKHEYRASKHSFIRTYETRLFDDYQATGGYYGSHGDQGSDDAVIFALHGKIASFDVGSAIGYGSFDPKTKMKHHKPKLHKRTEQGSKKAHGYHKYMKTEPGKFSYRIKGRIPLDGSHYWLYDHVPNGAHSPSASIHGIPSKLLTTTDNDRNVKVDLDSHQISRYAGKPFTIKINADATQTYHVQRFTNDVRLRQSGYRPMNRYASNVVPRKRPFKPKPTKPTGIKKTNTHHILTHPGEDYTYKLKGTVPDRRDPNIHGVSAKGYDSNPDPDNPWEPGALSYGRASQGITAHGKHMYWNIWHQYVPRSTWEYRRGFSFLGQNYPGSWYLKDTSYYIPGWDWDTGYNGTGYDFANQYPHDHYTVYDVIPHDDTLKDRPSVNIPGADIHTSTVTSDDNIKDDDTGEMNVDKIPFTYGNNYVGPSYDKMAIRPGDKVISVRLNSQQMSEDSNDPYTMTIHVKANRLPAPHTSEWHNIYNRGQTEEQLNTKNGDTVYHRDSNTTDNKIRALHYHMHWYDFEHKHGGRFIPGEDIQNFGYNDRRKPNYGSGSDLNHTRKDPMNGQVGNDTAMWVKPIDENEYADYTREDAGDGYAYYGAKLKTPLKQHFTDRKGHWYRFGYGETKRYAYPLLNYRGDGNKLVVHHNAAMDENYFKPYLIPRYNTEKDGRFIIDTARQKDGLPFRLDMKTNSYQFNTAKSHGKSDWYRDAAKTKVNVDVTSNGTNVFHTSVPLLDVIENGGKDQQINPSSADGIDKTYVSQGHSKGYTEFSGKLNVKKLDALAPGSHVPFHVEVHVGDNPGNVDFRPQILDTEGFISSEDDMTNADFHNGRRARFTEPQRTLQYFNETGTPRIEDEQLTLWQNHNINNADNAAATIESGYGLRSDLKLRYRGWRNAHNYGEHDTGLDFAFPHNFNAQDSNIKYAKNPYFGADDKVGETDTNTSAKGHVVGNENKYVQADGSKDSYDSHMKENQDNISGKFPMDTHHYDDATQADRLEKPKATETWRPGVGALSGLDHWHDANERWGLHVDRDMNGHGFRGHHSKGSYSTDYQFMPRMVYRDTGDVSLLNGIHDPLASNTHNANDDNEAVIKSLKDGNNVYKLNRFYTPKFMPLGYYETAFVKAKPSSSNHNRLGGNWFNIQDNRLIKNVGHQYLGVNSKSESNDQEALQPVLGGQNDAQGNNAMGQHTRGFSKFANMWTKFKNGWKNFFGE